MMQIQSLLALSTPVRGIAALAVAALLSAGVSVPATSQEGMRATTVATTNATRTLNGYRSQRGLAPLRRNSRLDAAAQRHASFMAQTGQVGHRGRGGSHSYHRVSAQGYCWRSVAENIAWGQPNRQSAIVGWMNSPGHRRHILNGGLREFGMASNNGYWVMVLATPC